MNLVDSCGWLEFFADGPNAGFFSDSIQDSDKLVVPTVCILEVFKRVLEQRGETAALEAITAMQQGKVVPLDAATALNAARLSSEHKLALADSVILATAHDHRAVIWTQDADFRKIPGVKYRAKR